MSNHIIWNIIAIFDTDVIKQLTRFRLNFTHLKQLTRFWLNLTHIISQGFRDVIDNMCKCEKETLLSLALQFIYTFCRTELLKDIYAIDSSIKNYPEENLLSIPLYWSLDFNNNKCRNILKQTIKYLIRFKRFSSPFFNYLFLF